MLDPQLPFDVFVSYRQRDPDRGWVRSVLVPYLKAAGLRVFIDYEEFRLGAPLVSEMARGVEQSRFTLAVLSPGYLESNFTQLESVMAEHMGLEHSEHRLVAIKRWPCTPGLAFRAKLWLDLIDDAEVDGELARLVRQLVRGAEAGPSR